MEIKYLNLNMNLKKTKCLTAKLMFGIFSETYLGSIKLS